MPALYPLGTDAGFLQGYLGWQITRHHPACGVKAQQSMLGLIWEIGEIAIPSRPDQIPEGYCLRTLHQHEIDAAQARAEKARMLAIDCGNDRRPYLPGEGYPHPFEIGLVGAFLAYAIGGTVSRYQTSVSLHNGELLWVHSHPLYGRCCHAQIDEIPCGMFYIHRLPDEAILAAMSCLEPLNLARLHHRLRRSTQTTAARRVLGLLGQSKLVWTN